MTINESSSGIDTQIDCDEYTWIDGITYTESTDSATFVLTNSVGCDSIVTLDLTINYSDSTFSDTTVCDVFVWGDSTYTESGIYTHEFVNVNGCDSSHTVNLTVNYSDSTFSDITVCDAFVWGDSTYTESGVYTHEFENVNNCDSTHTVNLTVNESSFVTEVLVACDEYTWIDGITYTESTNSITDTLLNVLGCDSIVTLDLTINYSDSTYSDTTVCDVFVWGDSTYTESGVYTYEFVTAPNGRTPGRRLQRAQNRAIRSRPSPHRICHDHWFRSPRFYRPQIHETACRIFAQYILETPRHRPLSPQVWPCGPQDQALSGQ